MKKNAILTIATVFFLSCSQTANKKETTTFDNQDSKISTIDNTTVQLSTAQKMLKLSQLPESIEVAMTNNTTDTIMTGLHYHIQKLDADEWQEITPQDILSNDIGFQLNPDEIRNFAKNLFKSQILYTTGKYRIVKYYLKSDYQKTRQKNNVYAEFNIED